MPPRKKLSRKEIEKQLLALEEKNIVLMDEVDKQVSANRVNYFTPFTGVVDPNKTLLVPKQNPKQEIMLRAMRDPDKRVFTYTGANRVGKSAMWAVILPCLCAGKWLWDGERIMFPHRHPRKIRIVGQDWEKHVKTVVIPALKEWWPAERPLKVKKNANGIEAHFIDVLTGSTIEIMSNFQDSALFEGWHGDAVFYDEPPKRENRVACARGLIDRTGIEVFCMTLLKEAWVDREVIRRFDENGEPDRSIVSVNAEITDNVGYGITLAGVEQFKKTLKPHEIQARIKGVPSYKSGLIWGDFKRTFHDEGGHLVRRFPVPTGWPVDIAIDIHPKKPQAILFLATAPNGYKYLIYEVWENGDGNFIADSIIRIVKANALRVNRVIIDPLSKGDPNHGESLFDVVAKALMPHEMYLETASKDKTSGILKVADMLYGPNRIPSLFFFPDLTRTVMEIEGWMFIDKGDDKGKPSKEEDDMMENLYRLSLLDTRYTPLYDEEYGGDSNRSTSSRDARTGY